MDPGFRLTVPVLLSILMLASPAAARPAQDPVPIAHAVQPAPASGFHADAELDPTAYVLDGFSIHVGLAWKRWRFDLGNYAMALPRFVHGNSDYDVSFDGFGAKLQYFLFAEQAGGFVGVDGGANRLLLQRRGTDLAARQRQYGLGAHAGWRFRMTAGLYLTLWAALSYTFNPHDVSLAGSTFTNHHLTPFAAVHVGYQFR